MKTLLTLALLASAMVPAAAVAQNRDAAAKQFLSSPKFAAAKAKLAADHDRIVMVTHDCSSLPACSRTRYAPCPSAPAWPGRCACRPCAAASSDAEANSLTSVLARPGNRTTAAWSSQPLPFGWSSAAWDR